MTLVEQHAPRKLFLIIDNGPCHWLDDDGKEWLRDNKDKVELYRLPPYSPQFNPVINLDDDQIQDELRGA